MIGAIIQARMGSTRYSGKILKPLNDKTVLEHIVKRVQESRVDECIVATTNSSNDDIVEEFCAKRNIKCFRGSENDVLERFYLAAKKYGIDIIVRVTADDPLKDTEIINKAISILVDNNYSYVSNTINPTYPEGIDVEVFRFETLEKAYNEAKLPSEHEHVTPYIWKNPDKFNIHNFESEKDLSKLRWTMDTEDDYVFMQKIYAHFVGRENFSMEEVLEVLDMHPEYLEINQGHIRNEGYLKSIKEE